MRHHLVTGVAILAVLLGLGLWTTRCLDRTVLQAQQELQTAFQLAAEDDLDPAHTHVEKARKSWEKTSRLAACLIPHQKLEQVDGFFDELNAWYETGNAQEYALVCRRLSLRLRSLLEGEKPYFYNLL